MDSNPSTRKPSGRSKSGCRTCRIRKVKCDEGRPACRRCISTGRVCDGYGIWGGGGNDYHQRRPSVAPARSNEIMNRPSPPLLKVAGNTEENRYLQWFTSRILMKIPGPFALSFWGNLIMQASLSEPAVLHAVLTLSSIHKREVLFDKDQVEGENQFMLQHYIKAIQHLRPHFSVDDRASKRVALIACLVFVWLECLRGRFQTAQTHLQNGMKILESQESFDGYAGMMLLESTRDPIDDCIVEAFFRLRLHMELFERSSGHPRSFLGIWKPRTLAVVFYTTNQAWNALEVLLDDISQLSSQARHQQLPSSTALVYPATLLEQQECIKEKLATWFAAYESCKDDLQKGEYYQVTCTLISEYHIMANIMVDTCLHPDDEMIFENCTAQFVSIICHSRDMWRSRISPYIGTRAEISLDMAHSTADMGWIPPLYYTALKCRIHRVRLQAIRLLESSLHREGMWDSIIAAHITRRVMEIEERDVYRNYDMNDSFSLATAPEALDFSFPILPDGFRLHEMKVELPDSPTGCVWLSYKHAPLLDGQWIDELVAISIHKQCSKKR
ncbi:hypothetical protein BDV95DRAFT_479319 [Massariosphaeria phaeospora]|uniref:Zn(2)-C6 fungal-type domain-containing protein n=1 Tax=Massariosphaeria phaeospora TaxID=100035 RepID=A0A7C8MEB4_9PLEO|nr:hypothetical protein BDV95DRAFT_479319 [Massariosphaeria phaeospora]